ncbi:MAG: 16S rRNA (cytosine(1402)-N(4))-methyltransferase RsmH [Patescibacteria group bacterium]
MHTPVLLNEVIEALNVKKSGKYIDATIGECGHLKKIAELGGNVLGIDWDESQIEKAKSKLQKENVTLAVGNFAELKTIAEQNGFTQVDGILFDLGLSFEQMMTTKRGFSYKNVSEPLDMRIATTDEITAANILNTYSKEQLYEVFSRNSEEILSMQIAQKIFTRRFKKKYETVYDLVSTIAFVNPPNPMRTNARIFQALRIEVNHEKDNLKSALVQALDLIVSGGVIVVISFHSIEDRIVKDFAKQHRAELKEKKLVARHSRVRAFERSAVLRIMTKI